MPPGAEPSGRVLFTTKRLLGQRDSAWISPLQRGAGRPPTRLDGFPPHIQLALTPAGGGLAGHWLVQTMVILRQDLGPCARCRRSDGGSTEIDSTMHCVGSITRVGCADHSFQLTCAPSAEWRVPINEPCVKIWTYASIDAGNCNCDTVGGHLTEAGWRGQAVEDWVDGKSMDETLWDSICCRDCTYQSG